MSGNINKASNAKKVLIVAANPGTSSVTQWPVGFWWSELVHPYWAFAEVGYEIEIRSPEGGALQADGYSDPEDESGYSADDILSLGFKKSPKHRALLDATKSIDDVDPSNYDAVFLVGGQSPMFTFRGNEKVQGLVRAFYEAGKVTALVCHATCVLLEAKLSSGELLVSGKTWTGFANSEERFADEFVGQKLQPFWIEEEARALPNTNFVVDQRFREYAVRDGLLVTGQQQFSGAAAARLVIEALGR
ncbi:MAG: type 1 glutamine amidotransferase domain-containing protein [Myxococcota bacterium]